MKKIGRNELCPCGSGRKYKQCCMQFAGAAPAGSVRHRPIEAAREIRRGGRPDPNHFLGLANALQVQGKWDEAIACYHKALALEPDHVDAHNNLGALLHRQGKLKEAVASYRNALSLKPDGADLHYNLACALRDQGSLGEAIESFRKAISIRSDHVLAHINLGNALGAMGDLNGAVASYRKALAFNPDSVDALYNLGIAHQQQGDLDAAMARYQDALALAPDHLLALYNLASAFSLQGRSDEAAAGYRKVLALKPDFADARNSLGGVLQAQGRVTEAIDCYRAALAIHADDVGALNNLGNALAEAGQIEAAFASYRRALELEDTPEIKANIALCIRSTDLADVNVDSSLRRLVTRAVAEPWGRPGDLARASIRVIRADPVVGECVARAARGWPSRLSGDELFGAMGLTTLADDELLLHLLTGTQVCELAMERFVTMVRHAMLERAVATDAASNLEERILRFYCAIARQCFINEFVFASTENESRLASRLLEKLIAGLQSGEPVPALWIAATASYAPLSSLPCIESLMHRSWPESVMALLVQHIVEPLAEQRCRGSMRKLTSIDDAVSSVVRQQYEENPYPRWTRLPAVAKARSLNRYLRQQFPSAPFDPLGKGDDIDVLIAGCGTGQEAIETAQRFRAARLLALDLSLSSLSYAKRKADEMGITNIEYAQGDILKLGSIGRAFDMIASVGVLHHLGDPTAGLQVLLSLLRPGGFMRLGLYSERARRDVVAAREFIAERGYGSDAHSIRRCRQDLIDRSPQFERLTSRRDFYATSECRDLLFHAQEHRLALPQIKEMLASFGLQFIGFLLEPQVILQYQTAFPEDKSKTDLDCWDSFEREFPDTFTGMYRFWIQKPVVRT